MRDYIIQADVMGREQRRRMSNIGVTAQRYNLVLKGNSQELELQSWAGQRRIAQQVPFAWSPDAWYTLKLQVVGPGGQGLVRGKAWKRGSPEPEDWTIQVIDPQPNREGSPGLYVYTLAESFFDNVLVQGEEAHEKKN